jgi:hypothetical protein
MQSKNKNKFYYIVYTINIFNISLNPVPSAHVCVYLIVHITKLTIIFANVKEFEKFGPL